MGQMVNMLLSLLMLAVPVSFIVAVTVLLLRGRKESTKYLIACAVICIVFLAALTIVRITTKSFTDF